MAVYFSKSQQEKSKALLQVEREFKTQKVKTTEGIYEISHAFANARQISV